MRKLKGYFIIHCNKLDTPLKNTETPTGIGLKIFNDLWVKMKDFQKITSHRWNVDSCYFDEFYSEEVLKWRENSEMTEYSIHKKDTHTYDIYFSFSMPSIPPPHLPFSLSVVVNLQDGPQAPSPSGMYAFVSFPSILYKGWSVWPIEYGQSDGGQL